MQILQLPEGADDDRPPFVLIVDQYQPLRYMTGLGEEKQVVDEFEGIAEKIGARAVLVFWEPVEIPANDLTSRLDAADDATNVRDKDAELRAANEWIERLTAERDEARQWARHGYEIGQKHCGWSDHGVAPAWLTEGWPRAFGSCEHLKQTAEFDEALTRVRNLPTQPDVMDSQQERPDIWLHGYKCGVLAARAAAQASLEPSPKDG
ncbi:hypothetical protein [Streptomyces flaveolus]|uniref:hypothetical protein n=1 Tax=Streptomyces flaveolus TaxID=67297 RepID=UPI0033F5F141